MFGGATGIRTRKASRAKAAVPNYFHRPIARTFYCNPSVTPMHRTGRSFIPETFIWYSVRESNSATLSCKEWFWTHAARALFGDN